MAYCIRDTSIHTTYQKHHHLQDPPFPIPSHTSKFKRGYFGKYTQSHNPFQASPLDEFENFSMSRSGTPDNGVDHLNGEEMDSKSATAAMKVAMDRAEAKFRHAKEVREREHAKSYRNKGYSERADVQRAQDEACDRATIDAKGRAKRAAGARR
ncbi:unnamed protein product [Lactuca saligna]|uniref:Uncharacterized protein n=1 Tax=Lactuca saligna TaxID=75948 RepID=A0AA35VQE3_LACSI|nr:unnamed protein product [Lactuca saligna]